MYIYGDPQNMRAFSHLVRLLVMYISRDPQNIYLVWILRVPI